MFEKYENDIKQRKSIIALLYQMANSDNHVSALERRYLNEVAESIGLDIFAVKEVLENPSNYHLESPPDEGERMTILYYLLFMMRVDGKIEPQEEKLVYEAGFRLGFNELLTKDLIQVMKKYLTEDIPPEAMLEQIRKYLN